MTKLPFAFLLACSVWAQCICPIKLPIEVVGLDGTSVTVPFDIPGATDVTQASTITLQIHNLKYQTEASLRVNSSAWIPLNDSTVKLQGLATAYGGIGGGFSTLKLTVALPGNSLVPGMGNAITFRFNGTDGRTSGFRVLALNIQMADANLIDSSRFTVDDPSTWQPPLNTPVDIAAGKSLWQTAPLKTSMTGPSTAIQAHCGDCHTQDGRDLKYFNYSNTSIAARSMFHGLTSTQGNQIASYIRSLTTPAPGRPWNPPYQPGPGLDSQPVANWAGGAGIAAVLENDAAMQPYLMPGQSTAGWSATQYLNARETPIALQLADWNSWLPSIHPMDAFPSFGGSKFATYYPVVRSILIPGNAAKYATARFTFDNWSTARGVFLVAIDQAPNINWDANNLRASVYSAVLWHMVKLWEINQEFGLEGMPYAIFGAKANLRAWYGGVPFFTSPTLNHIPAGSGLANGTAVAQIYISQTWYQAQLILNDGQGQQSDHSPLDFAYAFGRIKDLSIAASGAPAIMNTLEWLIKTLQEETLSGNGPDKGVTGWNPTWVSPSILVEAGFDSIWTGNPYRTALLTSWTNAWFPQLQQYTPQQFYTGGWAKVGDDPAKLNFETTMGGQIWFSLPRLRFYGVNPQLTFDIADWAAKIWPAGNWALNKSATCTSTSACTSGF